jgi:hypothetical protein
MGPGHAPPAAIVIIGDEILSGKVVDTNSPFLALELHAIGWKVVKIAVLPDNVDTIARCASIVNSSFKNYLHLPLAGFMCEAFYSSGMFVRFGIHQLSAMLLVLRGVIQTGLTRIL